MRDLILIRGLPGSGKSTFAQRLLQSYLDQGVDAVHFEADQFFVNEEGEYVWDGMKIGEAHAWCQSKTFQALENDKTVIVSNTFTVKKELQVYFDMIHQHGQNPTVLVMQSNFGSVHGVPDAVLMNMRKRFTFDIADMFATF